MRPALNPSQRAAVHEGADELRSKLRSDLSRLLRVRRYASLGPTIGCVACDAQGRVPCTHCGGSGKSGPVIEGQRAACPNCDGTGSVTCIECAGTGQVPNVHRKKVLVLLSIGGLAWLLVLFWLWGGDVAPEFRANLGGQGGGKSTPAAARRGSVAPGPSGAPPAGNVAPGMGMRAPGPGGAPANPGGAYAPSGGAAYPQGTGAVATPGGSVPQGGVSGYQGSGASTYQGGGASTYQGGGASTYRGGGASAYPGNGAAAPQGGGVSYPPR